MSSEGDETSGSAQKAGGPGVVVVGSINMDLVARVRRLPRPGQTVQGQAFHEIPGGKGANQAVAAARLGARCAMVGRVGDDGFGARLRKGLASNGVDVGRVTQTDGCPSGAAMICVEATGENAIVVAAGANGRLSSGDVEAAEGMIAEADAVLVQLEVPVEAVEAAAATASRHGVQTVLDPAPAPEAMPDGLLGVDVMCPNQSEAEAITGLAVRTAADAERAAGWLRERGVARPIITLGSDGAVAMDRDGACRRVPARCVEAVDSTAAGDAFAGALAVAIGEGRAMADAVRFACAAGTLAASAFGAQPAMPERAAVEAWLMGDG